MGIVTNGLAYVTIVMKEISDRLDDGNEQPATDRRSGLASNRKEAQ